MTDELLIAVGRYLNWYTRGDRKDALDEYALLKKAYADAKSRAATPSPPAGEVA